jgi:hypothetical protein
LPSFLSFFWKQHRMQFDTFLREFLLFNSWFLYQTKSFESRSPPTSQNKGSHKLPFWSANTIKIDHGSWCENASSSSSSESSFFPKICSNANLLWLLPYKGYISVQLDNGFQSHFPMRITLMIQINHLCKLVFSNKKLIKFLAILVSP